MPEVRSSTAKVAILVDKFLRGRKLPSPGPLALHLVFDVLFNTSLKTEEQKSLTCSITYLDPSRPDPEPPLRIRNNRWGYFRFRQPIAFSAANLAKIARAVDPRVASLAIHVGPRGNPVIWGIIDQLPLHYTRFVTWEADAGPEVPGLFHATVTGIGEISVYREYQLIASLRQERITGDYQRVLWAGPVHSQLHRYVRDYLVRVRAALGRKPKGIEGWEHALNDIWLGSLCRILLRMSEYRHGGAILIQPRFLASGLKINYPIEYARLGDALIKYGVSLGTYLEAWAGIFSQRSKSDPEADSLAQLYLERSISQDEKHDCQAALAGSVGLIASLSCVDGLVLLDSNLTVRGFGVEITDGSELNHVYLARSASGASGSLRRRDTRLYGTRHRSMIRYCARHPGAIGFVVSQDGPVRAITRVRNKVVMWEDIQLRLALRSTD